MSLLGRLRMRRSKIILDFVRFYPECPYSLKARQVCGKLDDNAWCPCCLSFWIRDHSNHHYGSDNTILIRKRGLQEHFKPTSTGIHRLPNAGELLPLKNECLVCSQVDDAFNLSLLSLHSDS